MIKAILMDFNGVIIDDEPVQMRAYQEVLKGHDIDLTDADYYASLGMDDRTFVAAAFERAGKKADSAKFEDIVAAKSAMWKEMVSAEMPLFEGIENFVEKMAQEFDLGIVSMAARHEIDHVLDSTGLRKHFATIVSAEDVANCKPDPECFRIGFRELDAVRTAAGHLPMVHADCLVIEDSPPGVAAARNADLLALGVSNTVSAAELRAAGAAAVAKDLRDWMPESIRRVFV
ncbi:MAG: HAD family phosphatase [Pyrinomonadaceae bacterium]|nr:HAD family phosphatase [Acidobacteriota bacterium]MBP7375907.1 HAD family phosphatase [Pyrinomonadaceae bacterium]